MSKRRALRRRYGRSRAEWRHALRADQAALARMRRNLATLRAGGHVENLTVRGAQHVIRALRAVIANKRKLLGGSR